MTTFADAAHTIDSKRIASRVTWFVFVTVFLDLIGFGIIIPLLPLYVQTMGGSAQTVGFILASFSFTQLAATPLLGRLSDRIGRRPVILLSLAGNALSMIAFAAATKLELLPLLFVSRIMAGATAGNLSACQAAIADVTTGEERTKGMGRLGAGIGLGLVLGPMLGSTLSKFGGWAPPLAAAAMALADLACAFFLMPETRKHAPSSPDGPTDQAAAPKATLLEAVSERRVVLVLALYFLTFLGMSNMQVALALFAKVRLGWGETEVGHVFGLFGLVMLVVQGGLMAPLTRRFGEMKLVLAGTMLAAAGLAGISVSYRAVSLISSLVVMSLGIGIVNPVLSAIASEFAGARMRGTVLGFAQSAGGLARTVGPVWGGFLFARVSPGAPFAAGSVAAGLAFVLALRLSALRGSPPPA